MIRLMSDSACDVPITYAKEHQVEVIPLYITFDGEHYQKDREELKRSDFYYKMVEEKAYPMSSLPSVDDYYQRFKAALDEGDSVICITITNTLSGSYGSAHTAYNMIKEENPKAPIAVYDSLQNTASQALVVEEMVRMRDDGLTFEEMNAKMPALLDSGVIVFTVGSLEYLRKGGRIGKLATTAAGKLNLRPLLILEHGKLGIGGISRTRKKSIEDVYNHVEKVFASSQCNFDDYVFTVGHGYDAEEGEDFRNTFMERFPVTLLERKPDSDFIVEIGPVSAVHTGPHALGVAYIKKYELV
ncbi:MAG: DegV family protein [Lachnospiraceae bacterium]|nr:DegV family protein [Lachnospiraceae bacterium]